MPRGHRPVRQPRADRLSRFVYCGVFCSNGSVMLRRSRLVSTKTSGLLSNCAPAGRSRGTWIGLGSAAIAALTAAAFSGLEFTQARPAVCATWLSESTGSSKVCTLGRPWAGAVDAGVGAGALGLGAGTGEGVFDSSGVGAGAGVDAGTGIAIDAGASVTAVSALTAVAAATAGAADAAGAAAFTAK